MESLKAARVVHFYDTRTRETLCGLRGFEERSTKHARGVTCPACAGLLHERLTPEASRLPESGGTAASA